MIIDTTAGTVTLGEGEILKPGHINALLAAYNSLEGPTGLRVVAGPAPKPVVPGPKNAVTLDKQIRSASSSRYGVMYTVLRLSDGSYACSCPDWVHRRSHTPGDQCKHIALARYNNRI
jgi:hypothetical protein